MKADGQFYLLLFTGQLIGSLGRKPTLNNFRETPPGQGASSRLRLPNCAIAEHQADTGTSPFANDACMYALHSAILCNDGGPCN